MLINLACYHLEFNVNHAIENKNIRISEEEEFNKKRRNFLTLLDKINTFDLEKTKEEHVDVLKKEFIDIMEFCQQYNREFLIPLKEKNKKIKPKNRSKKLNPSKTLIFRVSFFIPN